MKASSLIENKAKTIKERIEAPRTNLVPRSIITCWVHVAKTMKAVFKSEITANGHEILHKCLQEELTLLPKV